MPPKTNSEKSSANAGAGAASGPLAPPPAPPLAPPPVLTCGICRNTITIKTNSIRTSCNHCFHKSCFAKSTNNRPSCPTCGTEVILPKVTKPLGPTNTNYRNQTRKDTFDENRNADTSILGEDQTLNTTGSPRSSGSSPRSVEDDRRMIRNLVTAAVGAQQAEMLSTLNETLSQLVQSNFEAAFRRMSIQEMVNPPSISRDVVNESRDHRDDLINNGRNNTTGIEDQSMDQLLGLPPPNNRNNNGNNAQNYPSNVRAVDSGLSGDLSVRPDRISQIINNWRLKFSGSSSSLSVDAFIYRIEALTRQTLRGDFEVLCDNASALFDGKASDWFWRHHQSVRRIRWPELCSALRSQYRDTRTDMDYRELIRDRKQRPGENFDTFYESIVELTDRLETPLSESSLAEILRRNLLPDIQHEILNIRIISVEQLRDICRKREFFLHDIRKRVAPQRPLGFPKRVSELVQLSEEELESGVQNLDHEVCELGLTCWNCGEIGHRYQECMSERTVFCYGCGASNIYKPSCRKCNPSKNVQKGAQQSARKQGQNRKSVDHSTNTDQ